MARFWLHNGFLDMRGEKMSKSLGNVVRVPEALEHWSPGRERCELLICILAHTIDSQLDFDERCADQSAKAT